MPSRTAASYPLRSPCKSKRGTKRPFDVKQPNAPPSSFLRYPRIHPSIPSPSLSAWNRKRVGFRRLSRFLLQVFVFSPAEKKKKFRSISLSLSPPLPSRSYRWKGEGGREVARNWLSNVGLMTGCRARLCATFIEISSRAGTRVFFLFPFFLGDSQRFSRSQNQREIQKYSYTNFIYLLFL